MGYIYKITNTVNGKAYIGKTVRRPENRIRNHLNGNTPQCAGIFSAVNKYGKDVFVWEILYDNIIPELLSDFEIQAIKKHNTKSPYGYNLTDGGDGTIGLKFSLEHREALSKSHIGHISARRRPEYTEAYNLFFSLPLDMHIADKRDILFEKYPNIKRYTIYDWIKQWHTKLTGSPPPSRPWNKKRDEMCDIFCRLPQDIPLFDKVKILRERFPCYEKSTVYYLAGKWQSKLDEKS